MRTLPRINANFFKGKQPAWLGYFLLLNSVLSGALAAGNDVNTGIGDVAAGVRLQAGPQSKEKLI